MSLVIYDSNGNSYSEKEILKIKNFLEGYKDKGTDSFLAERLALKFLGERLICEDHPCRDKIVDAFCVGFRLGESQPHLLSNLPSND